MGSNLNQQFMDSLAKTALINNSAIGGQHFGSLPAFLVDPSAGSDPYMAQRIQQIQEIKPPKRSAMSKLINAFGYAGDFLRNAMSAPDGVPLGGLISGIGGMAGRYNQNQYMKSLAEQQRQAAYQAAIQNEYEARVAQRQRSNRERQYGDVMGDRGTMFTGDTVFTPAEMEQMNKAAGNVHKNEAITHGRLPERIDPYADLGSFGDNLIQRNWDYLDNVATQRFMPEFAGQVAQAINNNAPAQPNIDPETGLDLGQHNVTLNTGIKEKVIPTPRETFNMGIPNIDNALTFRKNEQADALGNKKADEDIRHNKTVEQMQREGNYYKKYPPQGRAMGEFETIWNNASPEQRQQMVQNATMMGGGSPTTMQTFAGNQASANEQLLKNAGLWDKENDRPKDLTSPSETSFRMDWNPLNGFQFSQPNPRYQQELQAYQQKQAQINAYNRALQMKANPYGQAMNQATNNAVQGTKGTYKY